MTGPSKNGSIELALTVKVEPGLIVASLSYGGLVEPGNDANLEHNGELNISKLFCLLLGDSHRWVDIFNAEVNQLKAKEGNAEDVDEQPQDPSLLYIYSPQTLHVQLK